MAPLTKAEVMWYWALNKELLEEANLFIDWGEPTCWACNHFWDGKYDVTRPEATRSDCSKAWNKAPLQLCHIIPKSLGGSDTPENIFLMCRECHDLAPDTTKRAGFFSWVKRRQSGVDKQLLVESLLQTYFPSGYNEEELISVMKDSKFSVYLQENTTTHWNQAGYGGGSKLSSFIAAMSSYLCEKKGHAAC